jgi:hypothetical protein
MNNIRLICVSNDGYHTLTMPEKKGYVHIKIEDDVALFKTDDVPYWDFLWVNNILNPNKAYHPWLVKAVKYLHMMQIEDSL